MGHVPSQELSSIPFQAELQTSKGHVDRLVGVALTKWNFPSIDCPQFQQFVNLRCDPHVLHWFNVQNTQARDALPQAPEPEYLYERHVTAISDVIAAGVPPHEYFPVPFVLFRHNTPGKVHPSSQGSSANSPFLGVTGHLTMDDVMKNVDQFHVVGYLGCRGHTPTTTNLVSLFLEKSFWNEAKSVSIFQIGCRMYDYFSGVAGVKEPRWPQTVRARSLDTNLPLLRLIQKIYRDFGRAIVESHSGEQCSVEHINSRIELVAPSGCLQTICTALASTVKAEGPLPPKGFCRFRLHTQGSGTNGMGGPIPTPFDGVIEYAKSKWSENNLVVSAVKQQLQQQQQELHPVVVPALSTLPTHHQHSTNPVAVGAKEKFHSRKSSSSSNCAPTPDESTSTEPHSLESTHTAIPPPSYERTKKQLQVSTVRLPTGTAVTILVPSTAIPNALTPLNALWSDDALLLHTTPLSAASSNGQIILEVRVPPGFPIPLLEPKCRAPIACAAASPCLVILNPGTLLWVSPATASGNPPATPRSTAKPTITPPSSVASTSGFTSTPVPTSRGPLLPFVV